MIAQGLGPGNAAKPDGIDKGDIPEIAARLENILGTRLEVVQPIAIGGMATIFLLRHRLHHGLFVAKVLHPGLVGRPGIVRSFRAEAIHAARLGGHPNAIAVFDFGELDGLFYMTMPYVEGEDLDKLLQRAGPIPQDETMAFASQVSSLLSFAETEGITHCDLTPANVRRDVFGTYRVLDFGISRSEAFQHDGFFRGGTPLYTSPEQLLGETPDHRSDLYALGAIMAEMLTGEPLFHADTLSAIDRRHLDGDWILPPNLQGDRGIGLLLKKLLATKREDRMQSAFELSGILDGLGFPRPEFRGRLALQTGVQAMTRLNRRSRLSHA